MPPSSKPQPDLVPAGQSLPSSFPSQLPLILSRAGQAAVFATEEFFCGRLRNANTRAAYLPRTNAGGGPPGSTVPKQALSPANPRVPPVLYPSKKHGPTKIPPPQVAAESSS